VEQFSVFTGLRAPAELRTVTRAHVIAWRKSLEARNLTLASVVRSNWWNNQSQTNLRAVGGSAQAHLVD